MRGKNNEFWMDDDPEWQELRRKQGDPSYKLSKSEQKELKRAREAGLKAREQQAKEKQEAADRAAGIVSEQPKKVNVSVNLTLPQVNTTKLKRKVWGSLKSVKKVVPSPVKAHLKKRSRKQLTLGFAGLTVVLVIGILGLLLLSPGSNKAKVDDKGVLAKQTVKIDFKPLLPNGNDSETTEYKTALDGQNRPIYTFTDKIGTVDVTVTEQPLPDKLKTNTTSELESMAKDLYLTEVINQSNPKAYLGTSVKGPQTVIFAKNNLIVFIQSQSKIDKDQWSDYVTRLVE